MPKLEPPIAAVRAHTVSSPHGKRSDPYYWLRDDARTDPEVLAYLKQRMPTMRSTSHPSTLEDNIYAEIIARLKQDDSTVPYRKKRLLYYIRFEPGKEHPIFARRKASLEAPEQVILDANELAIGHEYYQIGEMDISPIPSGWPSVKTRGASPVWLALQNLRSGEILPGTIGDVEPEVAWANDNETLLYIEKDPETLLDYASKSTFLDRIPNRMRWCSSKPTNPSTPGCRNPNPTASFSSTWMGR